MDEISKSQLKAKMFEYFRRIESTKRPLVVKDFGEPVLVIYPYQKKQTLEQVFGNYRGKRLLNRKALLEPETEDWGE